MVEQTSRHHNTHITPWRDRARITCLDVHVYANEQISTQQRQEMRSAEDTIS